MAFSELHRVLKPKGVSLIVYSWGRHSVLMALALLPFKAFSLLKRLCPHTRNASHQTLYFHAFPYRWVRRELQSQYGTQVFSWRSVNVPFLKKYICRMGWQAVIARYHCIRTAVSPFMGRFGAYPLLVSQKP